MREKRCTRQFALIAGRNVKFPSSLMAADRFIAESAIRREHPQEEVDFRSS